MAGITDEQKNHSIFRGKAISIDQNLAFFNPSDGNTLVFDERTEEFIEVQILNKITKRKQLKAKGRTLKMGILLEGPYGCGKTALAQYIAALAIKHDLTFLYVKDPDAYEAVLNILKNYDNCIVLLEDLDRLAGDIDKIANWLDAVDTKGDDTMSIFTTNHGEVVRARMPKIMRTGRIGDTITIKLPGRREREQLFNLYCRQNGQSLAIIGDINPAIDESEGLNGSAIAHICETAIQFAESYDADMENGLDSKYLALAASYNAQYNARIAEWDVMNTKKDAPTIDTLLRAMLDGVDNPKTHVPLPDILESARKYLAQKEEESVDSICEHMDMKFHELRSRPNK
jgi:SpoVK/Ycf46/Vps4 family AAA+-type ATPase